MLTRGLLGIAAAFTRDPHVGVHQQANPPFDGQLIEAVSGRMFHYLDGYRVELIERG
jgi:hypothetical protein